MDILFLPISFTFRQIFSILLPQCFTQEAAMSEFSNLLSSFIKNNDTNVRALTNYCDLDRSTMYKLINGKRNPSSKELVQRIAAFMNLDPVETQELINAYRLTKIGWETYYQRKNVLEFLLNFADIYGETSLSSPAPLNFSVHEASSQSLRKDTVPLSGHLQISSAIHKIFLETAACSCETFCIFAQPEHLEALNISASLLNYHPNIKIQHILCINNSKSYIRSQQNYNIQCLKKIIPLYQTANDYQPYYYYDNVNSHFNNLNFMPCLFLAEKAAILCDSDLKEGILISKPDVLALFKKRFLDILENTEPLALKFVSGLNFHLKSFSSVYSASSDIYGLNAEPCLIPFFSQELLEKYIKKSLPNREELIKVQLNTYIKSFTNTNMHLYFTRDGVLNFLMSGKLHEIPESLYHPLDYADRIKLLRRLYKAIETSWDMHLLKGALEKFPLTLHLMSTPSYGYLMFSNQKQDLSYILLKEQNILSSFYDFCSSLEENEMLVSKEKTLSFLDSLINQNSQQASLVL